MKVYKGGKSDNSRKETDPNLLYKMNETEKEMGKKVVEKDSEIKYSQMLLELIKPYHSNLPHPDEVEDLLELATIAWNMSNMKKLVPMAYNVMWQETKQDFGDDKESIRLLEKMVKEKTKKFSQCDMFIHNAQLNSSKDGFFVNVVAKPLESFLEEGFADEDDRDKDEINFSPGYINRNAFTVTPKQPFHEWLRKIEGNSLFPQEILESHVYLLEETDTNEEIEFWLRNNYDKIFRLELESWFVDEKQWPKNRNYDLFKAWFDISYQSMIYDLEDRPVQKD